MLREEIPLSDPSVEAGKGPTDAEVTNKKRPRKKTDYLYTEDDVSKKIQKEEEKGDFDILYFLVLCVAVMSNNYRVVLVRAELQSVIVTH